MKIGTRVGGTHLIFVYVDRTLSIVNFGLNEWT